MRILVDPGSYSFPNLGTLALLQVAVRRLRALWPDGLIQVLTEKPEELRKFCPGVEPVPAFGHEIWYSRKAMLGRVHGMLPRAVSRLFVKGNVWLRDHAPGLFGRLLDWRTRFRPDARRAVVAFRASLMEADVVVVSGLGGLRTTERRTLDTLWSGIRRGCVTAVFSLGISPEQEPSDLKRAGKVFRLVDLIALREGRTARAVLRALDVDAERVLVTGDDAIELAYERRSPRLGEAFGINLRIQPSSEIDASWISRLRPMLHRFVAARRVSIVPLPSATHPPDVETIRSLVAGLQEAGKGVDIRDPLDLIREVGKCRIVMAGAYHVAVFALAQGIPVVCVALSPYFLDKFHGLSEQFGSACRVVSLAEPGATAELEWCLEELWRSADDLRERLLAVAAYQTESSQQAYKRLFAIVSARRQ